MRIFLFADDVALLGTGRTTSILESSINDALLKIADWMNGIGLSLVTHKSEAVILSS